jgi:hypothetical protein
MMCVKSGMRKVLCSSLFTILDDTFLISNPTNLQIRNAHIKGWQYRDRKTLSTLSNTCPSATVSGFYLKLFHVRFVI